MSPTPPRGRGYEDVDHESFDRPRRRTRPRTKERPSYDDSVPGETNEQEFEGLSGVSVTVVVKVGTATVIKVQGLPYA